MTKQNVLLPEAVSWLTVWTHARSLTIDGGAAMARRLRDEGHTVFSMAWDEATVVRLDDEPGILAIWARPEAIPTEPFQFDVVLTHQKFHQLDPLQALGEIARVLRPGGCLSASYVIRDDSVPWVRRLAALLRHYDPMAMKGDYGHQSLAVLDHSKYFPEVEQRAFRVWQPVSLEDLQALVARQPLSKNLTDQQRERLQSEVADLFTSSVRPGENLRLPFQLLCVRAWVSHEELTAPVRLTDDGVRIPI
ncbi:class I SAM-dependent methyltransferase [Tessaracoccus sp. OS52]|uniref:class I SAM-dependent methyltransferase n=1 Tax=Tessaracoccus sp. OS52 TaxID=2886691 RepID=UPI001D12860C|nr:class I SAM-dependent methyltransferase [Tessaracoccus sp. OS52]MCC2594380.1 class I SAM-dependent methyltransferase [Tessaracoccus sp. OS52]